MKKHILSVISVFTAAFILPIVSAHAATYATKSWVSDYFMLKSSSYTRTQMDSRYVKKTDAYTKTQLDSRYVNVAGDTMTGNLTVNGTLTAAGAETIVSGELVVHGIGYDALQDRKIYLPPAAFQPIGDLTINNGAIGDGYYKVGGVSNYAMAPLVLPNGAIITQMTFQYKLDDAVSLYAKLVRSDTSGTDETVIEITSPVGPLESPYDYTAAACEAGCVVDYSTYYYEVYVDFTNTGVDATFRGIEIDYTVDVPN
jgi:hypothetical protein